MPLSPHAPKEVHGPTDYVLGRSGFEIQFVEFAIDAAGLEQLCMRAGLDDASIFKDNNQVCLLNG